MIDMLAFIFFNEFEQGGGCKTRLAHGFHFQKVTAGLNNNKQQAVYIVKILSCVTVEHKCFAPFRATIYQTSFSFYNFSPCYEIEVKRYN